MLNGIDDDLFAPDAVADPYAYYGRLREQDPVHWNKKYELWVVTRYDDLVWLTRHTELFSSEFFKKDPRPPYPPIDESAMGLYEFVREFVADFLPQTDPPKHTKIRKVLHAQFTPKSTERWRGLVQSVVKELLDDVEDRGAMDVMQDFAAPLPLLVIARMMGMPNEDRAFLKELSDKLISLERGEPGRMKPLSEALAGLKEYISPLVDERMTRSNGDLLSVLADGHKRGELTRDEVIANAIVLLVAGHETGINLVCNGLLALIHHPDQWELLQGDHSLAARATEECLRYDPPIKAAQRIALEDVEIRGKAIRRSDRVRWVISSANRDPEVFTEPDTFDITRHPNPHVAFGSGIHHCLGATLARIEGQEAFKGLVERFPSFRLEAERLEYSQSNSFRSLLALPVSWN